MQKNFIFIILLFIFSFSKAQVWEDFSDGNLTNWVGNVDSFIVNSSSQLQLNASAAGQAYLSTPLYLPNLNEDREWKFWIRENFAPSDNNRARFYLMADRSNLLDTALRGYYLRFGENLSADAVRLYRQQGRTHTLLCSGKDSAIASNFAIWVKVTRSVSGEWVLYCSGNGNSILKEEARCIDASIDSSNYLGLACYYTVTNIKQFYFDDIYCNAIYPDTIAPCVKGISPNETTKNEITITFNEDVDSSALINTCYEINHQVGHPSSVTYSATSHSQIIIRYNTALPANIPLTLHIRGVADEAGNTMQDTNFQLFFYQPQLFDVVISEIMAKPSPVVNLPDAEYVELRNRTNFPINLNGWKLQLGTTSRTINNTTIEANGYALVTAASNANLFSAYGTVATLSAMQITDAGQSIRLSDNYGNLVHFISFSNSWHENSLKKNGGWSLEMIDINNPCEEETNWASSQNSNGGTPCKENSVSKYNPDVTKPQLDTVIYEGNNKITVHFSETMLPIKLTNKNAYKFSHSLLIDSILSVSNNLRSVTLALSDSLVLNRTYTLTVVDTLFDCAKNAIPLQSSIPFGHYSDTIAPWVIGVTPNDTTKNKITITFNEDVDSSALINTCYEINHQVGSPSAVMFATKTHSQIIIQYDNVLPVNTLLTLQIKNISDIAGNLMTDTSLQFVIYQSKLFDIVISEIMAKPSPAVNLPDAEYVELRNRTNFPINLNGWRLQLGNTSRTISNTIIDANGYALITAASNANLFSGYGTVATLSAMQITDGGQSIRLSDKYGNLVHFVTFSDTWHENSLKRNGGWSLEMIDINNPCEEETNWASSQNNRGGTPCKENSISKHNPDIISPNLEMAVYEGDNKITVYFSETMLPIKLTNKNAYQIFHTLLIDSILSVANDLRSVTLALSDSLIPDRIYTLTVVDTLFDCVENAVPLQSSVSFGYATYPLENDIVINEVLFNPQTDGVEFVEIYNRSHKIIDLRTLRLSNYKSNGTIDTGKVVSPQGRQLFPQQYLVLTTKPDVVQNQYYSPFPENFIRMNSLPSYPNTKGTVILLRDLDLEVIDLFAYNEKMHYSLLRSYKGVSLERIHFDRKTQDEFNWHSAASTVGYATPGYKNSAFSENIEQTSHFEVYPEIFSPDGDGYNDILNISYSFPQPGYRASIYIYNVSGQKLRTLTNNQLLETEGYITWDGIIDGNIKASIGTYIILIEYWNLDGEVKRIKKTCTLAVRFK